MTIEQRWKYFLSCIQKPAGVVLFRGGGGGKSLAEITSASDVYREKEHRAVRSVIVFS